MCCALIEVISFFSTKLFISSFCCCCQVMEEMQVDYNHFFFLLCRLFLSLWTEFFMVYSSVDEKSKSLRKDVVD